MRASSFLLIVYLLGSLSERQVSASEDEAGGSRSDVFRTVDGKIERLHNKPNLLENIKAEKIWNWLYVYLNGTSVIGYSIRVSDKVMLTARGLGNKSYKMTQAAQLPDFFDPKEMHNYNIVWIDKPNELIRDCHLEAWLYIERFRHNLNLGKIPNPKDPKPPAEWLPNDLKLSIGSMTINSKTSCKLFSHRKLGDNIVTFSSMKVSLACNEAYGPLCTLTVADELKADTNNTYLFCPQDNGAPIFCEETLFAIVNAGENTKCLKEVAASRVNGIPAELKEIFEREGDHPHIFAKPYPASTG